MDLLRNKSVNAAGNTVMTHLLVGLDPKYIREAPYVPVANFIPPVRAIRVGLTVPDHVYLYTFPSLSSYVGGDIVSDVLSSGLYQRKEPTLYIDIGTNGEIVVGNDDWLMTASCSAGPAFEGGGLKCGMRAMSGAIEKFHINPATLEPMIMTIGRVKPKAICGSGAINILAEFLETGVIAQNDALKRRCLYHWIDHTALEREVQIIRARAPEVPEALARDVATAVNRLRSFDIAKRPGVSETIDWANAVAFLGVERLDEATAAATLGTVLKDHDDQELVVARLSEVVGDGEA